MVRMYIDNKGIKGQRKGWLYFYFFWTEENREDGKWKSSQFHTMKVKGS